MTVHDLSAHKLIEQINNLDIDVTVSANGVYTAVSDTEPKFCFDGTSVAELTERVECALKSYAKVYFGIEGFEVLSKSQDVVPVHPEIEASLDHSKLILEAA